MGTAASLPIRAARDSACLITLAVQGLDLTGAALSGFVKLEAGTPGAPLVALPKVTAQGQRGLRLRDVEGVGSSKVSHLELFIPAATMAALPAPEEPGAEIELYYQFDILLPGWLAPSRIFGPLTVSYEGGTSVCGEARFCFGPQFVTVRVDATQGPRGPAGSGGGGAALDELSIDDFEREDGDDAASHTGPDVKRMYRMRDAAAEAGKGMYAPAGIYEVWEDSQAIDQSITGLVSTDGFRLRGAGIDRTFFVGKADVLGVFYGNRQPRGTVQNPAVTEPYSADAIKGVELSHFTIQQPGYFLEQAAAIGIAASSRVHLHDLKIEGFAGDAIAALMANFGDGSQQGHNEDWLVERVEVDGLGQPNGYGGNNRNGVTINDMVRYVERDCYFHDLSRPGDGNQSPEDRTDPNKGPPMPGAGDIEFINGTIFDLRAADTLVENRKVVNTGGAGDVLNIAKGNRTHPPFPTSGENAADVKVLARNHRRIGLKVDRARLGLVSADGPPQAAVGFGAYYGGCETTNSGRSFEITRFRGLTMEGNWYYRSQFAGTLGYVINADWYVRDVKLLDETFEQCGVADGLTLGIFQCDGVDIVRAKAVNCNGTFLRLGGQYGVIKNLNIDRLRIQNDGMAGLSSITASVLFVPQPGETLGDGINRQLDLRTIRISFDSLGGAALPNFPWPEGLYPNAWRVGSWDADTRVFCSSSDPGAPEGWRTAVANTLPARPRPVPYGKKGLYKPDSTSLTTLPITTTANLRNDGNGRYTSLDADQTLVLGTTVNAAGAGAGGGQWIVRGIFDRTSMLFVGFHPDGAVGLSGFTGVWFDGGLGGTYQRVGYVNGGQQALQGSYNHEQFTRIRAYYSSVFGPVLRIYTGTTENGPWTPTGAPIALSGPLNSLVPYILFGACGESLNTVKFETGTGNGDA